MLISHKVFFKLFCRSQFPHKSVNLSFSITYAKKRLTDLCGNSLLQNDFKNTLCGIEAGPSKFGSSVRWMRHGHLTVQRDRAKDSERDRVIERAGERMGPPPLGGVPQGNVFKALDLCITQL